MPRRVIKVPPIKTGRRVHLTFEVSADVGTEGGNRAGKKPKHRRRTKTSTKKARASRVHRKPLASPELAQDAAPPLSLERTAAAMTAFHDDSVEPTTPAPAEPAAASAPQETVTQAMEVRTEPIASVAEVRTEPVVPAAAAQSARRPAAPARTTPMRSIALAATAFIVIALLAFPRPPSAPATEEGATASKPEVPLPAADLAAPAPTTAAAAPRPSIAPSKKSITPKPETARTAKSSRSVAPIAPVTSVATVSLTEDVAAKLPGSEALPPPPMATASSGTIGVAPVTITGCLEVSVSQDEYRLTDTEGIDAPKSRSWKTGFLKRRAAPVSLIEPSDRTTLRKAVGRRVAATGTLNSHDLKVSAVRVVGPSCN
ncbi:MAG TPA: hypothetical protein VFI56_20365 [Vicinamibacterales bacterium]|nr:hypothetical protein [Vicinamibacterales bacterium]